MSVKFFLQQLLRSPKRTMLNLFLLAAVTAFFVMSLNLYHNSVDNLARVEENYTTIAVMELYGDVDKYGQLTDPDAESHDGYYSVGVRGYDFSEIVSVDCVEKYDLRSRYAAYIPDCYARGNDGLYLCSIDHIRFRILSEEPVELMIWPAGDVDHDFKQVQVEVLYSATGLYQYGDQFELDIAMTEADRQYYSRDIQRFNRQEADDRIILYPDVEYYMVGTTAPGGAYFYPTGAEYGKDYYLSYFRGIEARFAEPASEEYPQPFYIQRWEDIQNDTELSTYFEYAEQALRYTISSFCVMTTNDVMGIPAFHLGGAQLYSGRFITEEEYASGAKVCMISQTLANKQLLDVGDKLDMNFYLFDAFPNADMSNNNNRPAYTHDTEGFFDQGEYEIVGIYSNRELDGNSTISESALVLPWINIFIPEKSLVTPVDQTAQMVHGNLLTIWLENGTIDNFLDHVNGLGITEPREGEYTAQFTFYDQGYSIIQPSLQAMLGTSELLLVLSSILLAVTSVLLSWFFAQGQKQSAGILRMLGGTKRQAVAGILLSALLIAVIGTAVGTGLGAVLTQKVGSRILGNNLQANVENADFRAYILSEDGTDTSQVSTGVHTGLTLAAGIMGLLPFMSLLLFFVLLYIGKEPRALLPKTKA